MRLNISKYYREKVPYRIRHAVRQFVYRVICLMRCDAFVTINSPLFQKKSKEIYREKGYIFNNTLSTTKPYVSNVWRISNVSVYGASDIIKLDNHHYLYEIRDFYLEHDKKGISVKDYQTLLTEERGYFLMRRFNESSRIQRGILISSYFANNYYHYTFQCIARMRFCEHIDKRVPILVHESVEKYASFKQLLQICNVDNREVVYLNNETQYDVDELFYISPQMISVPCYREGAIKAMDDDWYSIEALGYIRKVMLPNMDREWQVPERIFLARRYASGRRGYNEEECYQRLEQHGFVEVRPEMLSLEQQIALFNKAKYIVGATGAAFTNLVYGNSDCTYIILKGAKSEESIFTSLAAFNNSRIVYICDNTKEELKDASQEHEDFHIDAEELEKIIIGLIED